MAKQKTTFKVNADIEFEMSGDHTNEDINVILSNIFKSGVSRGTNIVKIASNPQSLVATLSKGSAIVNHQLRLRNILRKNLTHTQWDRYREFFERPKPTTDRFDAKTVLWIDLYPYSELSNLEWDFALRSGYGSSVIFDYVKIAKFSLNPNPLGIILLDGKVVQAGYNTPVDYHTEIIKFSTSKSTKETDASLTPICYKILKYLNIPEPIPQGQSLVLPAYDKPDFAIAVKQMADFFQTNFDKITYGEWVKVP